MISMVGPLKFFSRDPNRKGRGRGLYYHRGHGYYSKYSKKRDAKIRAKHGTARVGRGRYAHTHDFPELEKVAHELLGRVPKSLAKLYSRESKRIRRKIAREHRESEHYDPQEWDIVEDYEKAFWRKVKEIAQDMLF